jgi:repressor LexA
MRELTSRQQEILDFIRAFSGEHGVPPTVREIGQRFRITPRAAFDHLRALERKGELVRRASAGRTSRALTLAGPGRAPQPVHHAVPILGRIAAGALTTAAEDREGELPIAAGALPGRGEDLFALRVRGQSMVGAHIVDGDLVLVRRQDSAQPNDIVVALVDSVEGGEATVKRFLRDGPRIVLKPENPAMSPIVVDPAERPVKILGKVIGLLRGF